MHRATDTHTNEKWSSLPLKDKQICENSGTEVMDLTMPPTEVPAVETTYMCTAFTFSDDVIAGDFHAVGLETVVHGKL